MTSRNPSLPNPLSNTTPVLALHCGAFLAAFAGVAYELLLASYATYLLGASLFQYSIVLSLMMASMGVGSLLTQQKRVAPLKLLISVELVLALIAPLSIPALYFLFSTKLPPQPLLYFFVVVIGMGLGMEIPLLEELSQDHRRKTGLDRILFYDYIGGFLGGLIFPLWLVPQFGFFRIAALLSLVNAFTGWVLVRRYGGQQHLSPLWAVLAIASVLYALAAFLSTESFRLFLETTLFEIQQP